MALDSGLKLEDNPDRQPMARFLRVAGEAVLLALVALSPWPYASNDQPFELAVSAGVLLLASLWAAHAAIVGRLHIRLDAGSLGLAGLCLWSAIQLIPLPESLVGTISPSRLEWHQELLPEQSELLPGETEASARPDVLTLSINPTATRTFTARALGVLIVYLAARNWIASRTSFRRLAWVMTINGVALAIFALVQFFTAPQGTIFWIEPIDGEGVFGPFVCRNHYVDYAALCAGFATGLLLARRDGNRPVFRSPRILGLTAAVGIMLASIPFSLSRGGMLAVVVAAVGSWILSRTGGRRPGTALILAVGLGIAFGLAVWLGLDMFESRLESLEFSTASRFQLWRDAFHLVPGTWLTGTGAGTFQFVEPTVRTGGTPYVIFDHVHNEYLEALIEGGVVRLLLTLGLTAGVLYVVGRGAVQRRERSVGPLLLGAWFGLTAVALHAIVDFGIHMPAVAVATAIVAGFAVAGATDSTFIPRTDAARRGRQIHGLWAGFVSMVIAVAALLVALDSRSRDREERLRVEAEAMYWKIDDPDRFQKRVALAEARAEVRPSDPDALFFAAQAHLDAAIFATWTPGAALAGGAAGYEAPPERFPPAIADRHLVPALRYLRAARTANPLAARAHARLGLYVDHFTGEPAGVHFSRAKRILPTDSEIWYVSGREAAKDGNLDTAWSDWRHALALSPRHLGAIVKDSSLSAEELSARLPDDPVVQMLAADLYSKSERRPFADSASKWRGRDIATTDQLAAAADACEELGRTSETEAAWRAVMEREPDRIDLRSRYAAWLEREERYADAIPHLEWLHRQRPGDSTAVDRLDAARHGLKLQQAIARPGGTPR